MSFTAPGSLRETSLSLSALAPASLPQEPSGAGNLSCPAGSPGDPDQDLNPLPVEVVNFCRFVNTWQQLDT